MRCAADCSARVTLYPWPAAQTIYFAALTASKDVAKADGHYPTFPGSPMSKGVLQYDMWGVKPSPRWDWEGLKKEIAVHGTRNSLLLAPMPTASTSQVRTSLRFGCSAGAYRSDRFSATMSALSPTPPTSTCAARSPANSCVSPATC